MRQTIECDDRCNTYPDSLTHGESISKTLGFPLRGLFCDGCGEPLTETQLVVAVGIWCEDKGIYNIASWYQDFIREATEAEIKTYRQAEASAKEMRKDGDRNGTV